jgi:hypothetical protein
MIRRVKWFGAFVCVLGIGFSLPPAAYSFPENRVYEMVSPPYKGGYGVEPQGIEAIAQNGDSVEFSSKGAFAGALSAVFPAYYIATRSVSGWSTVPLSPPASLTPIYLSSDISPTLETMMALGKPGANELAGNSGSEEELLLYPTNLPNISSNWEVASKAIRALNGKYFTAGYSGSSPDFCHLFLKGSAQALAPEAAESTNQLALSELAYEFARGCNGEQTSIRVVGLNNRGKEIESSCGAELGVEVDGFNDISEGGKEVFFTTSVEKGCSARQLFVRIGGRSTFEISKSPNEECRKNAPDEVPCEGAAGRASASFVGASRDGSRVFFTTTAQLLGGSGKSTKLYMARIGCSSAEGEACIGAGETSDMSVESLIEVSSDPNASEAGEVQGVVRVAPDGSRIYFVAKGDLLSHVQQSLLEGEGRPVPHVTADNLYVYDSFSSKLAFIGDLCSGLEASGGADDSLCPSETGVDTALWTTKLGEAQTAGISGGYLVFATYAQLTKDDTDAAKDIYRYDADTGALERISGGEDGYDANGNRGVGGDEDASIRAGEWGGSIQHQYEMNTRAVSEDGSRIVFTTAAPLSEDASNGLENAYEWHKEPAWGEGKVSLISSGNAEEPVSDVVISPDGDNVDFVTTQSLVPQDIDGAPDIYDARAKGGFSPPSAPMRPCDGDACQGPLTNPAPLLVPGSVSQEAGGNFAVTKLRSTKSKVKAKKKLRKKPKKRKAKTKRISHSPLMGLGGR